jgi:Lar family restriction alleviation protein
MMEKLKPCPFCGGGEAYVFPSHHEAGNSNKHFWMICSDCEADGPLAESESKARELWNKRVSE